MRKIYLSKKKSSHILFKIKHQDVERCFFCRKANLKNPSKSPIFRAYKTSFMILSMTGYGKGEQAFRNGQLIAEIRSLNSKGCDIRCKLPQMFREKEVTYRRFLQDHGIRGKFDLSITIVGEREEVYRLDIHQYKDIYRQLKSLQEELGYSEGDIAQTILRIPSVLHSKVETLQPKDHAVAMEALKQAMAELDTYRSAEGEATRKDLQQHTESILDKLKAIETHEQERNEYVRDRLWIHLNDRFEKGDIDESRFEQEVLYYLEKLDISEEKVRLSQHCEYFMEQLNSPKKENGRTLNFISQEMGREINTLGSKANYHEIQHLVVQMKEDLEKIKEQVANIL